MFIRREDDASRRRRQLIESVGGKERVEKVMEFARWFCQQLLDGYGTSAVCSVTLALLRPVNAIATWSSGDVLTLGIDTPWLWTEPFGEESLATLIHEAAHHLNAHHGRDFHKEMEKLAGRAARIMLLPAEQIRQDFGELISVKPEPPGDLFPISITNQLHPKEVHMPLSQNLPRIHRRLFHRHLDSKPRTLRRLA